MKKRNWTKAICFLLTTCLLTGNSYLGGGEAKISISDWTTVENGSTVAEAAEGDRYVILQPGSDATDNDFISNGSVVKMEKSTMEISVSKRDANNLPIPWDDDVSVRVSSGNTAVVEAENYDGSYFSTLKRKGPGTSNITVLVVQAYTDGTGAVKERVLASVNFQVLVELKVVDSDVNHWKITDMGDGGNKALVLNQKIENEYQLNFKYIDEEKIENAELYWELSKDGVVSIDENGKLSVLGAGYVTLKIYTELPDGKTKANEEFEIVVSPVGSNNTMPPTQVPADPSAYDKFLPVVNMVVDEPNFTIYSNGFPASNLTWEVASVDYAGKEKVISPNDKSLLTYVVSEGSGNVNFMNVKAGTYVVRGYVNKDRYGDTNWAVVTYNIVVNLSIKNTTVYMNVGDTYSILQNSNVPENLFQYLFTFTYTDKDHEFIAGIDRKTGLITALNKGTAEILMSYNKTSNSGIYDKDDSSSDNLNKQVTYTIKVIDGIALNTTSMSMFTGATYQLTASVTDRTAPITWISSDPSFATVDNTGLVTAVRATGATRPVQIFASQTIDGVTKSAVCNIYIQPAVTKVTLNPSVTTLEIGEYETIKATVSPSGIAGTTLRWLSSDTSVFEIVDFTDLSATIQGKAGGVAVLTAINAENVVVGYCKVTVNQQAETIKLSETNVTAKLSAKTYQLYATLTPANTTNTKLIWSTTDGKIATVDQNGKVTFKASGKVTIVVQSEDNPALIAYCNFEILKAVTNVRLDEDSLEMYSGESHRLTYLVTPANASNLAVTWVSFNPSVVAVDSTGMLTAKSPGTTQIMIMTQDGSYYDICTVVVKQKAVSVKMNYTEITMNAGEYFDMEVTVAPATSTEKSLTWQSLNSKVVTVSSTGRITARAEGTAVVLVKTESGVTSYCTVTVLQPVISMELDPSDITIDVGDTFTIEPVFKPDNATNREVTWESSDESIAEVNAIGEVTGISGGTAVIICETVDGGYRSYCLVRVEEPVVEITINPDNYRLGLGKSYQLEATISNHGTATDIGIIWSSSDESVCTVDDNGKIYGVNYGYATIMAEAADGYGAYATCEVRVVREVTSLKLNVSAITIVQGETFSLKSTIKPSNATYTTAIFTSSDDSIAMVDEDGLITGLEPGKVLIRADARDNSGKYAICHVTVIEPVASTGVTVSDKELVMLPGEKKQVTMSIKPVKSTDTVTWSSNNEAIASVTANGTITAHQTGNATITVMTSSGKTATVEVIVLGLSRDYLELPIYTQYSRLTVDGAKTTVRWDVEDTSICEVKNGVVTARRVGTTYVTATINGRTIKCKVVVTSNKKKQ
ncbi:MAG: hypothetical protein E7260_00550 [Lachnospiraceae bacterium]|nr:hypothetical protein [Lachnospiraceae bacterium]